jgi:hypothetical protein
MKEIVLILCGVLAGVFACGRIATTGLMFGFEWSQTRGTGAPKWPLVMAGLFSSGTWVIVGAVVFVWWFLASASQPAWAITLSKGIAGGVAYYALVLMWVFWRRKKGSKSNVQA